MYEMLCVLLLGGAALSAGADMDLAKRLERTERLLEQALTRLERVERDRQNQEAVAFAAELRTSLGSTPHVPLPYDGLLFQVGGGYTASSATFKAPTRGVYHFSWSTMVDGYTQRSCSYLALNGNFVPGFANAGNYGNKAAFSSQSALLLLEQGDEIQIRMGDVACRTFYSDSGALIDSSSNFIGFLVSKQ